MEVALECDPINCRHNFNKSMLKGSESFSGLNSQFDWLRLGHIIICERIPSVTKAIDWLIGVCYMESNYPFLVMACL